MCHIVDRQSFHANGHPKTSSSSPLPCILLSSGLIDEFAYFNYNSLAPHVALDFI